MKFFINWIYGFALAIGGPGLFAVAFLDSSFVSLPQINDILVVLMVTQNKAWMPYYAAMATLGSMAGCYVIYTWRKRSESFLRKRLRAAIPARLACTGHGRGAECRAAAGAGAIQAVRADGGRGEVPPSIHRAIALARGRVFVRRPRELVRRPRLELRRLPAKLPCGSRPIGLAPPVVVDHRRSGTRRAQGTLRTY